MKKQEVLMKRYLRPLLLGIFIASLLLLAPKAAWAATCTANNTTASWNTAGDWDCGNVPTTADDVVIPVTSTVTLDTNGVGASLTVSGTLKVGNGGAGRTLTISATVFIDTGGAILADGNNTAHSLSLGGDFTNNGIFDGVVALNKVLNVVITGTGQITGTPTLFQFNDLTISGTSTVSATANFSVTNSLVVNGILSPIAAVTISDGGNSSSALTGSGTVRVIGASFLTQYALTSSDLTNLTVDYSGTTQNVSSRTYSNLILSGNSGDTKTLTDTASVTGTLTITTATFDANGKLLNVAGDWMNDGVFNANGGTVAFNGATLIGGSNPISFNHVIISSTGTLTAPATSVLTVAGNWNNAGTFNANGGTVAFNGNTTLSGNSLTVNHLVISSTSWLTVSAGYLNVAGAWTNNGTFNANGGTVAFNGNTPMTGDGPFNHLIISGTLTAPSGNLSVAGDWALDSGGTFAPTSGTVVFNGSGAQAVTGATTFYSLTLNNASGLTLNNDVAVGSGLSLMTGTLNLGPHTLTMSSTVSTSGGSLNSAATGTVNYAQLSDGQAVVSGTYGNLTFSAYTKTLPSGLIQIAGMFSTGATGHSVPAGNTIEFNQASGAQAVPDFPYANLTLSGGVTKTLPAGALTLGGDLTLTGGVSVTAGGDLTVTGDLAIGPGATFNASSFNHNLKGHFINSGAFNANSGTMTFSGALQILTATGTTTFNNLVLNTTQLSLTNPINVNTALTVSAGTLSIGSSNLTLNGNVTVTAGTGSLDAPGGTVTYGKASSGQAVLPGSYNDLTFSSFGKILPSGTIYISGTFTPGGLSGHTLPADNTIEFDKAGNQNVPSFPYFNLTLSGGGLKSLTGTTTINGNLVISSPARAGFNAPVTVAGNLLVNSGASLDVGAFTHTVLSNLTNSGTVTATASTFVFGGATIISGNSLTLNHVVITNSASLTASTGLLNVRGNWTNNGTFYPNGGTVAFSGTATTLNWSGVLTFSNLLISGTLNAPGGKIIHVTGDWTNKGTFNANNGTVEFDGAGAQNLGGAATTIFGNLIVSNSAGLTLNNNVSVSNALTLIAGSLEVGATNLTLSGTVTTSGGGLSATGGTVTYAQGSGGQVVLPGMYGNLSFNNFTKTLTNSLILITGDFTPTLTGGHATTGSTLEFNQTGPQNVPTFNYYNLTLSGSGTKTLAGTTSLSNTLTISSGVTLDANGQLLNVAGDWTNNGAFNANNGTAAFNGDTLITGDGPFYNVIISSTGTLTASAGLLTVTGNWTLNSGGTFNHNTGTLAFSGTTVLSGTAPNFYNVLISGTLNGGSLNVAGDWTRNGGLFSAGSGIVTFTTGGVSHLTNAETFNTLVVVSGKTLDVGSNPVTVTAATNNGRVHHLVNNFNDPGTPSGGLLPLRRALLDAQAIRGTQTISITQAGTITLSQALTMAYGNITLDARPANFGVILSGLTISPSHGLQITGDNNTVQGLVFNGFFGAGAPPATAAIDVTGANNLIFDNRFGLSADGTTVDPVTTANSNGILLGGNATNNRVISNTIAGSLNAGIVISDSAVSNTIQANMIGLDPSGVNALGVQVHGVRFNGTPTDNEVLSNTISGNSFAGVRFSNMTGDGNVVAGNVIGLLKGGGLAVTGVAQTNGIYIASNTTTGAATLTLGGPGMPNTISGNSSNGVYFASANASDLTTVVIQDNIIGLQQDGLAAVIGTLTQTNGVNLSGSAINAKILNNTISGNATGVLVQSTGAGNVIQQNIIGLNKDGANQFIVGTNQGQGVWIKGSATAQAQVLSNTISGNVGYGVLIQQSTSPGNELKGNRIGPTISGTLTVLGNLQDYGIFVGSGAANALIGGTGTGEGNIIFFNRHDGVAISSNSTAMVRRNSIDNNGALGIDWEADEQPAAGLPTVKVVSGTTGINVTITFNGAGAYAFDVFANNPDIDHNEGQIYLGTVTKAISVGDNTATLNVSGSFDGKFITATATNTATSSTTEFSAPVLVSKPYLFLPLISK